MCEARFSEITLCERAKCVCRVDNVRKSGSQLADDCEFLNSDYHIKALITVSKVKQSRYRPEVAQRVAGS
jgi:hypothetical protein